MKNSYVSVQDEHPLDPRQAKGAARGLEVPK